MEAERTLRELAAYLAPERPLASARKHIALIAVLLGVAAIAGAVVLKPTRGAKPHFTNLTELVRLHLSERSQIDLFDDFSQGLDAWQSAGSRSMPWSYDKNGFVNVGALSLFEPSLQLTDYELDALVEIESKAVGLVFRADSPRNGQFVKLVARGSGPLRSLAVEHYALTAGRSSHPVVSLYPEQFPSDALYRVHLEVRGDSFALYIQGKLMAFWRDTHSRAGGVGLFCSPGEHARVAWVRVSHNVDTVGRLCSWLTSML
jgi:hypothetical protein